MGHSGQKISFSKGKIRELSLYEHIESVAMFNLRRVFLPTAVWISRASVALRKSRFMISSNFTLFRFQLEDAPKRWSCHARCLATLLIAGVLAIGSIAEPAEAGLWGEVEEWYVSFQLGEVDEANIPSVSVEYVGEVALNLLSNVKLDFGEATPGIGLVYMMSLSLEGTLLIADMVGKQALEFNLTDGQYIRSFGRTGQGPGEYGSVFQIAVDTQGRIYVLDAILGQILRYNQQGQYLDKTQSGKDKRLLTGRGDEVFLLQTNPMHILEVQCLKPATWERAYRTPVSTDNQRFISFRLGFGAHLSYSPARHRLYYLGPNDYLVKEINADTGKIIRQFGMRPEGFVPLPRRYHSIWRGSLADMEELRMTSVRSMTLIEDQYLLVCHGHPGTFTDSWTLYDLTASAGIEAYGLDESALEHLKPFGKIAARQDRLYIWRKPAKEVAEMSNGTVEVYELSFTTN